MANLAIRGHATRGKEVIQILEMLGGRCKKGYSAGGLDCYYYISDNGTIDNWYYLDEDCFITFTLEEFLERFPYKVGDKVYVISIDYQGEGIITELYWDDAKNTIRYKVISKGCDGYWELNELQPYKEQEAMEEFTIRLAPEQLDGEQVIIPIPKGYEFAGVDDDAQQVVFEKIKPKYPKDLESVIKWQTGEPKESGNCIITNCRGKVLYDYFFKRGGKGRKYWLNHHREEVVAWCPMSEIEPYKTTS